MQSPIAEAAVIAAAMGDDSVAARVVEKLAPEDFYSEDHKAIFSAICELNSKSGVSYAALVEKLRANGDLESIGGKSKLDRLVEHQDIRPDAVDRHIELVNNASRLRNIALKASGVLEKVKTVDAGDSDAVSRAIASAQSSLLEVDVVEDEGYRGAEHVSDELRSILTRRKAKGRPDGVLSGFATIDDPEVSFGLVNRDLYIFMGVPGSGKTTFLLNIIRNVALGQGLPVAFVSLEMSAAKVLERLVVAHARSKAGKFEAFTSAELKSMQLSPKGRDLLAEVGGDIAEAPIFIDDAAPQSIDQIVSRARHLKKQEPDLALVCVDYIQLIRGTGDRVEQDQRANSLTDIAYALKNLAKQLDIPVAVTGQVLEKKVLERGGRLRMTDIKESGGIAQAANFMGGIEISYNNRGEQVNDGWIGFPVLKNRDGSKWRGDRIRFEGEFLYMEQTEKDAQPY